MDLSDEYYSLKLRYRKFFLESVQEIEAQLAQGSSITEIEALYKQKWQDELAKVANNRVSCKCTGCGVCCRFAVSEFSPEELKNKAKCGDVFASQFIQTFEPYKSLEEAKLVFPKYIDMLKEQGVDDFYVYHCPKVTKDNKCPDYENRPNICRDFPDNPVAFLPETCTYTPWKLQSESVLLKLNAEREIINFYLKELNCL